MRVNISLSFISSHQQKWKMCLYLVHYNECWQLLYAGRFPQLILYKYRNKHYVYSLTGCDVCQWLGDYFMLDLFPQSRINMYTTEINILCVLLLNQQFRINRIDKYKQTLMNKIKTKNMVIHNINIIIDIIRTLWYIFLLGNSYVQQGLKWIGGLDSFVLLHKIGASLELMNSFFV